MANHHSPGDVIPFDWAPASRAGGHSLRRRCLSAAARLCPAATARLLARRYLTPSGSFIAGAETDPGFAIVPVGRQVLLRFDGVARPAPARRLLIVPGHNGHVRQFGRLLRRLRETGASVDLLVLPGHLGPKPRLCSFGAIVGAVREVGAHDGPYDAVIAHCVGCNASLLAMEEVPLAKKLVFLSAPLTLPNLVRFAGRQYGLRRRCLARFVAQVSRLGAPYPIDIPWQPLAARRSEPLLVIHARNDYAVPVSDVAGIGATWPGARLALLDTGDHNTILGQRGAIDRILAFLQERPAPGTPAAKSGQESEMQ